MTGAVATTGEVIQGNYSGNLPGGTMHGINKAHAVRSLALDREYDLPNSFAYSDSINDLPLLVSVGNPFIVNPNKQLENVALKNRWPILTH